jgi:hypothetical protein
MAEGSAPRPSAPSGWATAPPPASKEFRFSRKCRVYLAKIYKGKPFDMFQDGRQLLHLGVENFVFPAKIQNLPREDFVCFRVGDSSSTWGSRISFFPRKFRVYLTKIYKGNPFDMFRVGDSSLTCG